MIGRYLPFGTAAGAGDHSIGQSDAWSVRRSVTYCRRRNYGLGGLGWVACFVSFDFVSYQLQAEEAQARALSCVVFVFLLLGVDVTRI